MAPTDKLNPMMKFFVTGCEWKGDIERAEEDEAGLVWKLMNWCAAHMGSGGFIQNCLAWDRKTWQKEAGIERKIFRKYLGKSVFFREENGGVRVLIHDAQREAQTLRTSERQAEAARAKAEKERKKRLATADATADATANADIQIYRNSERQIGKQDKEEKKERVIINNTASTSGKDCAAPPPCVTPPHDVEEVLEVMATECCSLTTAQQRECAQGFLDEFSARGWVDKRGQRVTDWRPAARKWARSWCEFENRKTAPNYGLHVNKRNEGTANEGLGLDCPLPMSNYNPNTVPAGIDPDEYNNIDF